MSAPFESLVAALEEEARVFEDLVACGKSERDHLISGDVTALSENLAAQKVLIDRLSGAETARNAALDAWRDRAPDAPDGPAPGLRSVIAMAPPDVARRLGALRDRLTGSAEELRTIARNNYFLALKGLEFVDSTVKIVADHVSGPEKPTYTGPGRTDAARGRALLVDRTA